MLVGLFFPDFSRLNLFRLRVPGFCFGFCLAHFRHPRTPHRCYSDLSGHTRGIKAFLALNQMGADFRDILPLWCHLWVLAGCYGSLSWLLLAVRRGKNISPQPRQGAAVSGEAA